MRKMKTPEMDVIRFDESDVIVASGGGTVPAGILRLSGFDNETSGDGTYAFGTKTYYSSQADSTFYSDLSTTFGVSIDSDTNFRAGDWATPFSSLNYIDRNGRNSGGFDGDYTWDGIGSEFKMQ